MIMNRIVVPPIEFWLRAGLVIAPGHIRLYHRVERLSVKSTRGSSPDGRHSA
jgi:hypothetical protein